jgi:hypothetical protein
MFSAIACVVVITTIAARFVAADFTLSTPNLVQVTKLRLF